MKIFKTTVCIFFVIILFALKFEGRSSIESSDVVFLVMLFVGLLFHKEIFANIESFKFGDVELKRKVEKIEKEQRSYALLSCHGEVVFSTFEKGVLKLVERRDDLWRLTFSQDPIYFELRGLDEHIIFDVTKEANSNTYTCKDDTVIGSGDSPFVSSVILEAYFL